MKYSEFIKEVISQMRETEKQRPGAHFICLAITDVHFKTKFRHKDHVKRLQKTVRDRIKRQNKDCTEAEVCYSTLSYLMHYYAEKKSLYLSPLEARIYWLESLVKYHSSRGN